MHRQQLRKIKPFTEPLGVAQVVPCDMPGEGQRFTQHSLCPQVPYRLHAVLVHEGQANAGHYWAYIYSSQHRCWMKYNDISVTESSWEELMRDSFGGYRNTSAYCLMYVNDKKPFLIEGEANPKWHCPSRFQPFYCNTNEASLFV